RFHWSERGLEASETSGSSWLSFQILDPKSSDSSRFPAFWLVKHQFLDPETVRETRARGSRRRLTPPGSPLACDRRSCVERPRRRRARARRRPPPTLVRTRRSLRR